MRTVDVIYAPTSGPLEVRSIAGTLESMQALVGGYVEAIPLTSRPGLFLYVNEEGWLQRLAPSTSIPGIIGPAFYGRCRAGDLSSVSLDDVTDLLGCAAGAAPCR